MPVTVPVPVTVIVTVTALSRSLQATLNKTLNSPHSPVTSSRPTTKHRHRAARTTTTVPTKNSNVANSTAPNVPNTAEANTPFSKKYQSSNPLSNVPSAKRSRGEDARGCIPFPNRPKRATGSSNVVRAMENGVRPGQSRILVSSASTVWKRERPIVSSNPFAWRWSRTNRGAGIKGGF